MSSVGRVELFQQRSGVTGSAFLCMLFFFFFPKTVPYPNTLTFLFESAVLKNGEDMKITCLINPRTCSLGR